MFNAEQLAVLKQGVEAWNLWYEAHREVIPDFEGADLRGMDLSKAKLDQASFYNSLLSRASLADADLRLAYFVKADSSGADLRHATLLRAWLLKTDLREADLRGADLREANLQGADLSGAALVRTKLAAARLTGCRIYGISAWDVVLDAETKQQELIITPPDQPSITVDNLEVAQFVYLLLRNEKIRRVIDTITSKVVLILGRFTPDRKAVLDALRAELPKRDRLPVIFDFDKSATRDTHETITTLARMARFIIADITEPHSIPQELVSIVEQFPSVTVQPILQEGSEPWGMFDHIKRYPWVLPIVLYTVQEALISRLDDLVVAPVEAKVRAIRGELSSKRQ